jgi:hypothetical protein
LPVAFPELLFPRSRFHAPRGGGGAGGGGFVQFVAVVLFVESVGARVEDGCTLEAEANSKSPTPAAASASTATRATVARFEVLVRGMVTSNVLRRRGIHPRLPRRYRNLSPMPPERRTGVEGPRGAQHR